MVKSYRNLEDYIVKYHNVLTEQEINYIISFPNYTWNKHQWTTNDTLVDNSDDSKEFDVSYPHNTISRLILNNAINKVLEWYSVEFKIVHKTHTVPRINRYSAGHQIEGHYDHITNIFEESKKGIPILSIVGLLNNNFEGGEFYFWEDTKYFLTTGDVLVFPSIFMYKHGVTPVRTGERWSFVSWAY